MFLPYTPSYCYISIDLDINAFCGPSLSIGMVLSMDEHNRI
jgi:hypothetical protein